MTTDHASMYQYFVNAIPTTYIDDKGNTIKSYQYLLITLPLSL